MGRRRSNPLIVAVFVAGSALGADPRFLLAGDSTMAPRNGYGDAFCALVRPPATCVNLARNGRSSKSFRADGSWDRVAALLADGTPDTYVLIQFGHNDQPGKAERSTDLEREFPANIARYVEEVRAAGATPVLVTPLTRRTFRDGKLVNDLEPWAAATRGVARTLRVPVLDLNFQSAATVEFLGSAEADTLALQEEFDRTHLGKKGADLFAHLVAAQLARAVPSLKPYVVTPRRPQLTDEQAKDYSYAEVLGSWDPLSDVLAKDGTIKPDLIVEAGQSVQSAIDTATTRTGRVYILVKPGAYRERIDVTASRAEITIYGDGDPSAVRIGVNRPARDGVDTPGSAAVRIRNDGFQAKNVTLENLYNKDRGDTTPSLETQAVALFVDGADRVQFENVRFLGFQDTLYLGAPHGGPARVFVHKSYVEGDMDFIFGEATAYFLKTEIRSLGDRAMQYVLAPSTYDDTRHGFVFRECRFTSDGMPYSKTGAFKLARQWYRSPRNVGKVAILESSIGAHIDRAAPWSDWNSTFSGRYRPVQYDFLSEYRNTDE